MSSSDWIVRGRPRCQSRYFGQFDSVKVQPRQTAYMCTYPCHARFKRRFFAKRTRSLHLDQQWNTGTGLVARLDWGLWKPSTVVDTDANHKHGYYARRLRSVLDFPPICVDRASTRSSLLGLGRTTLKRGARGRARPGRIRKACCSATSDLHMRKEYRLSCALRMFRLLVRGR